MDNVMLAGPIHSGKTKTFEELVKENYLGIAFTDKLKRLLERMLAAIEDETGEHITYQDLCTTQKSRARGLLAELGAFLDIDNDPRWAMTALTPWYEQGTPPAVLESIRTPGQWRMFKRHGFELVWLDVNVDDQEARAERLGVSPDVLAKSRTRPEESHVQFLREHAKLTLNTSDLSPAEVIEKIRAA
jgi:RNase adaptor protein for sRNA GlmZ degradation